MRISDWSSDVCSSDLHVAIDAATHAQGEAKMLALLAGQADFIVLARYMRILSADFVTHYPQRIINIYHSFLPAFRSEERRVGKEWVSTGNTRWLPDH